MNKKILFMVGAIGLFFIYQQQQKKAACETNLYLVDGSPICDTELNDMGYYYWGNGVAGSGYYHLDDFKNVFGFPIDDFRTTLIGLFPKTLNVNDPSYTSAQGFLSGEVKATAQPLIMAGA